MPVKKIPVSCCSVLPVLRNSETCDTVENVIVPVTRNLDRHVRLVSPRNGWPANLNLVKLESRPIHEMTGRAADAPLYFLTKRTLWRII